jgi:DNA-binding ferritin-like protein
MKDLAVHLRAMQIYAHTAHNLCARVPFFQDHAFFADTYSALEDDYDSVIERIIGTKGEQATGLEFLN